MFSVPELLRRIETTGFRLEYNSGRLSLIGDDEKMTPERMDFLRQNKARLIEYFESISPSAVNPGLVSSVPFPPELEPADRDHPPGDGADRDQVSAPISSYLSALDACIEVQEAEYAAAHGDPAAEEMELCIELAQKIFFPVEQRRRYYERGTALARIERLRQERESALTAGRTIWEPGLPDQAALVRAPAEYDRLTSELLLWFDAQAGELPSEPFILRPCVRVTEPEKFYASLQRDIERGPADARVRSGALRRDLSDLRQICERR